MIAAMHPAGAEQCHLQLAFMVEAERAGVVNGDLAVAAGDDEMRCPELGGVQASTVPRSALHV